MASSDRGAYTPTSELQSESEEFTDLSSAAVSALMMKALMKTLTSTLFLAQTKWELDISQFIHAIGARSA